MILRSDRVVSGFSAPPGFSWTTTSLAQSFAPSSPLVLATREADMVSGLCSFSRCSQTFVSTESSLLSHLVPTFSLQSHKDHRDIPMALSLFSSGLSRVHFYDPYERISRIGVWKKADFSVNDSVLIGFSSQAPFKPILL